MLHRNTIFFSLKNGMLVSERVTFLQLYTGASNTFLFGCVLKSFLKKCCSICKNTLDFNVLWSTLPSHEYLAWCLRCTLFTSDLTCDLIWFFPHKYMRWKIYTRTFIENSSRKEVFRKSLELVTLYVNHARSRTI